MVQDEQWQADGGHGAAETVYEHRGHQARERSVGAEELEWARAVLAEAQAQPGVFRFRGRMVDEPVLRQARRIVQG